MKPSKLVLKQSGKAISFLVHLNNLVIKDSDSHLHHIPTDQIEEVSVERSIDQKKGQFYEVNIKGNFVTLAHIPLQRSLAWKLKIWLDRTLEQSKKIVVEENPDIRYRPKVFKQDWLYSLWQVGAILIIFALLAYIFLIGLPGLKQDKNELESSKQSYQYFLEEGNRLVQLDRLTEGIGFLEDARAIKNSLEVANLLDVAYLERGEFYYQSKDFEKALLDLEKIKKPTEKSEKLIRTIAQLSNPTGFLPNTSIQNIKNLVKTKVDLTWTETKNKETNQKEWSGKKYDVNNGVIFTCLVVGKREDQIIKVILKTELMQKDIVNSYPLYEKMSLDYLSFSYQLTDNKEEIEKLKLWLNQWYPKVASNNYQIKTQAGKMRFDLLSEKGHRFLEINVAVENKLPLVK